MTGPDELEEVFDLAEPDNDFAVYRGSHLSPSRSATAPP